MQQRANFAAAKNKLVGHIKETYIDPLKSDSNEPATPRAKFGSGEGKVSTFLGMAPSQNEDRPDVELVEGALDAHIRAAQSTPEYQAILPRSEHFEVGATEHLPENVVSMKDFKDKKRFRKPEGY